jgi:biopolymer transport protein ExbD
MIKYIMFIMTVFCINLVFGCATIKRSSTESIDLSNGITINVDKEGNVSINNENIPVDKVMSKLTKLKIKQSDIIIIKVSPRASQRPVLKILDQLGDAKFNNITITSTK